MSEKPLEVRCDDCDALIEMVHEHESTCCVNKQMWVRPCPACVKKRALAMFMKDKFKTDEQEADDGAE